MVSPFNTGHSNKCVGTRRHFQKCHITNQKVCGEHEKETMWNQDPRDGLGEDGGFKYLEGGLNVCIELEDVLEPKGQAAGKQTLLYPGTFRCGLLKAGALRRN